MDARPRRWTSHRRSSSEGQRQGQRKGQGRHCRSPSQLSGTPATGGKGSSHSAPSPQSGAGDCAPKAQHARSTQARTKARVLSQPTVEPSTLEESPPGISVRCCAVCLSATVLTHAVVFRPSSRLWFSHNIIPKMLLSKGRVVIGRSFPIFHLGARNSLRHVQSDRRSSSRSARTSRPTRF